MDIRMLLNPSSAKSTSEAPPQNVAIEPILVLYPIDDDLPIALPPLPSPKAASSPPRAMPVYPTVPARTPMPSTMSRTQTHAPMSISSIMTAPVRVPVSTSVPVHPTVPQMTTTPIPPATMNATLRAVVNQATTPAQVPVRVPAISQAPMSISSIMTAPVRVSMAPTSVPVRATVPSTTVRAPTAVPTLDRVHAPTSQPPTVVTSIPALYDKSLVETLPTKRQRKPVQFNDYETIETDPHNKRKKISEEHLEGQTPVPVVVKNEKRATRKKKDVKPKFEPIPYATNGHTMNGVTISTPTSTVEDMEGWSEVRIRAYKHRDTQPNSYYYRFNKDGEQQKTGPWSLEEKQLFMKRLEEFGSNHNKWGLFSMEIPGRVGYQCLSFYQKLIASGEVQDPSKDSLKLSTELSQSDSISNSLHQSSDAPATDVPESSATLPVIMEPESYQIPASVYPIEVHIKTLDISSTEICVFCGSSGDPANLLFCADCGDCFHSFCLSPPVSLPEEQKSSWRCVGCKICEVCRDPGNEDQLLVCEICDNAFHTFCVGLTEIPEDSWICKDHTLQCKSCGSNGPDIKCNNFTLCQPCGALHSKGNFCTICQKVYPDDTQERMIQCDMCDKWIHAACDGIDEQVYASFGTEDIHYECPECRDNGQLDSMSVDSTDARFCVMCHKQGDFSGEGRLLPLDTDVWVHSCCALWSNECYETLEGGIVNVNKAVQRSKTMKCSRCLKLGATVGCSSPKCQRVYHFTCARADKCLFSKDKFILCKPHTRSKKEAKAIKPDVALKRRMFVFQLIQRKNKNTILRSTRVGALTAQKLGAITDRTGFHNQQNIFPVGYCSRRRFWSILGPGRSEFICEIAEQDNLPLFKITPVEDTQLAVTGKTPEECYTKLVELANTKRPVELPRFSLYRGNATGLHFFGLTELWMLILIESLPNAVKCNTYTFHSPAHKRLQAAQPIPEIEEELPDNPSGSARTEPFVKRKTKQRKTHTYAKATNAPFQQNLPLTPSKKISSISFQSELPDSMKYRLSKAKLGRLKVMRSAIHEWGVFTTEDIEEDEMIIEYIGEIVGQCVADKREKIYEKRGIGCYMFKIREDEIVDATLRGNKARFINHCCEPNASTRIIEAGGKLKIMIFAKTPIKRGTEITYDYQFAFEDEKIPCSCGAPTCRGSMN